MRYSGPVFGGSAVLAAAAALAGCAAVTTAGGDRLRLGSDAFRSYVERVFRDQNRVASDLGFAIEDAATEPPDLVSAEDALLAACAGLNELATSRRDQTRLGLKRSAAAARRAPDCERATSAARAALDAHAR